MKDKLYKSGHGKAFYRLKRLGIFLSLTFSSALVLSIPAIIAISNDIKQAQAIHAASSSIEGINEEPSSQEIRLVYDF